MPLQNPSKPKTNRYLVKFSKLHNTPKNNHLSNLPSTFPSNPRQLEKSRNSPNFIKKTEERRKKLRKKLALKMSFWFSRSCQFRVGRFAIGSPRWNITVWLWIFGWRIVRFSLFRLGERAGTSHHLLCWMDSSAWNTESKTLKQQRKTVLCTN